ncbi:MAG: hypothetical protein IPK21_15175 [Haliscomenobacter sp.]|nr:hypothetical protein [Haliscomenobacter sp.]
MGILALSAIIMAGAGFVLFAQSAPNYKPGRKKVQADLKRIRDEVLELSADLAPVRKEDLELISTRETQRTVKKWFVRNVKAVFTSIFEEPVIAYYHRHYLSSKKKDSLIFAKTSRYEFFFWQHRGEVQIVVNEQPLGAYDEAGGLLTSARTKKVIAKLDKTQTEGMPMLIQGKLVGRMAKLGGTSGKNPLSQRVFEFVINDLSPEEEAIVLAIAIFEMVQSKAV